MNVGAWFAVLNEGAEANVLAVVVGLKLNGAELLPNDGVSFVPKEGAALNAEADGALNVGGAVTPPNVGADVVMDSCEAPNLNPPLAEDVEPAPNISAPLVEGAVAFVCPNWNVATGAAEVVF